MGDPKVNADGTGNLSNVTNGVYNGVSDIGRNPMLLPNMDYELMINGRQAVVSTDQYLDQFPRVSASGTFTIGGTITAGDTLTVTINGFANTYTVATGDTTSSIAENLANKINANASLVGVVKASSLGSVGTVTAETAGPFGNSITFAVSKSTGATETITASPSNGFLGGGSGAVIPKTNFSYMWNGSLIQFWKNKPIELTDNSLIAALSSLNLIS